MEEKEKPREESYKYEERDELPYLINQDGHRFCRIGGQWLWTMGDDNPMSEDVVLSKKLGAYLSSILDTARKIQNPPALPKPKGSLQ